MLGCWSAGAPCDGEYVSLENAAVTGGCVPGSLSVEPAGCMAL